MNGVPLDESSAAPRRRDRDNIRDLLLEAAIAEFAQKGFDGASTTSIAKRADAHQPQINYHFSNKSELWQAAVDQVFSELDEVIATTDFPADPEAAFTALIRGLVEFAAARPELHQIMVQEATAASERLEWITNTHTRPRYEQLRTLWTALQDRGVAAPIDPKLIYYVTIGTTSLMYVNCAEARMLLGESPSTEAIIDDHVAGIVAMMLPGYKPSARP